MTHPRILSIDTETWGAANFRDIFPDQTCFTPRRGTVVDGVHPAHQILTLSLTLPKEDPRWNQTSFLPPTESALTAGLSVLPSFSLSGEDAVSNVHLPDSNKTWNATTLSALVPGQTLVFVISPQALFLSTEVDPSLPLAEQTRMVLLQSLKIPPRRAEILIYQWLTYADTLLGMNLPFDIGMMRARSALWKSALSGRHTLLDVSYLNFLESEVRPERSLKTIGPILGTHKYEEAKTRFDTRAGRFTNLLSLLHYMGQDTVNTMAAAAELAHRIDAQKLSAKLSPFCIQFYTDVIWCCIEMTENGVPFNRPALEELAHSLIRDCDLAYAFAEQSGVRLSNRNGEKGCKATQDAFMQVLITAVNDVLFLFDRPTEEAIEKGFPSHSSSALDHPLLEFTEKRRDLSFSDANRSLLGSFLPITHDLQPLLKVMSYHSHAQKLLSSYCYPYLWHQRKDPTVRTSLLCPQPGVPPCPEPLAPSTQQNQTSLPQVPPSPKELRRTSRPSSEPSPTTVLLSSDVFASPTNSTSLSSAQSPLTHPTVNTSSPPLQRCLPKPAIPSTPTNRLNPDIYLSHPSWFIVPSSVKDGSGNSGGTLQSRIVCKNGAHQTDPPEIQEFWQSRWYGGSIVSIDLSQIELRVAALLSGEPFFVNAFINGWDLHGRGALMLWGERAILSRYPDLRTVPVDKWKSSPGFKQFERQVGKQINFAHLFRAGADKMQSTVLDVIGEILPLSLFHRVVSARQSELPLLWEWQEARIYEARTTGRIILPFIGQSRMFLGGDKYDVNEIVNFPVQTTASNIILRVAARLRSLLQQLKCRTILPFLNVYDALKFDCKTASDVATLRTLWQEALAFVVDEEYYHWLQNLYARQIPIEYEIEVHTQE